MGSGNKLFDYTAEQKAALLDQAADVLGLVQEGKRPPALVKQALQAIIGNHEFVVVPKASQTSTDKIFHVTSDLHIRTAGEAIAATGCLSKWGLTRTPKKIPMTLQPVNCRVRSVQLGRSMTAEEIYFLPGIVSPVELFAFGAKFPEAQMTAPHFTVWLNASGQFFFGILTVYNGERYVCVHQCGSDYKFQINCRVLVRERDCIAELSVSPEVSCYPAIGEVFQLTLCGDEPENDPLQMVRDAGYNSKGWLHTGIRCGGRQRRRFMLVGPGKELWFDEIKIFLGANYAIPNGQWLRAFKDKYPQHDGNSPVAVADAAWVNPLTEKFFPVIGSDGVIRFASVEDSRGFECRWLVEVS